MAKPESPASRTRACAPPGEVIYAVGDVHGRADLLADLLRRIEADGAEQPTFAARLVTLGDYIDRGADSRGVLDILVDLSMRMGERMIALKGNHEAAMLDFLHDPRGGPIWCDYGGGETLSSYGIRAPAGRKLEAWSMTRKAFLSALPKAHLCFLQKLQPYTQIGDYLFVHAGMKPRRPLLRQRDDDMLWIREEFLNAPPWLPQVIVHGHTPFPEPSEGAGRIGIDTGAYATGVLTAVRLEGAGRRYIQTGP